MDDDHRIGRVEQDVLAMREDIGTLTRGFDAVQSDVKSLGNILNRIETGVARAQEKSDERSERNKPNLTAIVSVLITIISILVGGSWLISGSLSRLDERTVESLRERDEMRVELGRLQEHDWLSQTSSPQKTR